MRTIDPRVAEQVRRAIKTLTSVQGYPPSICQLARVIGVGRSRISTILRREEEAGRIAHDHGAYRSWRVVEPATA